MSQIVTDPEAGCPSLPADVVAAASPTAPADIAGVAERMRLIQAGLPQGPDEEDHGSLAELHGMNDGLACFNHLYHLVTVEILARFRSGDYFENEAFIQELSVQFARRYFEAVASYGRGACSSRAWQVLIERRCEGEIAPLQFAVAGVNTHINFDLPFAVVETCRRLGTDLEAPGQRHDYDRVNEVFFATIPDLRRYFEDRWQRFLDRGIFRLVNNQIDNMLVVLDRRLAWEQTEHLWDVRDRPAFGRMERGMDASAALVATALLTPLAPWL